MLKHLLFETRIGEALLAFAERRFGLAIVDANWLGHHRPAMVPVPDTAALGEFAPPRRDTGRWAHETGGRPV